MQYLPWILGTIAALLHGAGYALYNIKSKNPNPVSWSIWAFMALLNLSSFTEVTSVPHALQYVVGSFASIITFANVLRWGAFKKPTKLEIAIFFVCIASVLTWWTFKDASRANMIFLAAFLMSFYPMFEGVYNDPHVEHATAWKIWTVAFIVNLTNNAISWNGDWVSVSNPAILLLAHASIAFLSRSVRKDRFPVIEP